MECKFLIGYFYFAVSTARFTIGLVCTKKVHSDLVECDRLGIGISFFLLQSVRSVMFIGSRKPVHFYFMKTIGGIMLSKALIFVFYTKPMKLMKCHFIRRTSCLVNPEPEKTQSKYSFGPSLFLGSNISILAEYCRYVTKVKIVD